MPILKRSPRSRYAFTTGFRALALIGCTGLPSRCSMFFFISSHTELATVMPLPFRSMLKAVMMCALVPKPMVAASG